MALSVLQFTPMSSQSSSSPTTLTFPSNITAGSVIGVMILHSYVATPPAAVDTLGNVYTKRDAQLLPNPGNGNAGGYTYVFTATSILGGANTVTLTWAAGTGRGAVAFEMTGTPSNPYDTQNVGMNSSSPVNGGSVTPAVNGSLIVGLFQRTGLASFGGATVNTFFTSIFNDVTDGGSIAYGIQTTATTVTPSINATASAGYPVYGFTAVFSPSAGVTANHTNFFFGA